MTDTESTGSTLPRRIPLLICAWLWVAIPFGYGVDRLIVNLLKLFH
ncbi:MFS transporter small subunit [Nocardia brasiliensis]|nr:hypothetical protein [Nocardia brasiliensis]MBF6543525.1 hypothetical protein [Nocardia brasiliensis]